MNSPFMTLFGNHVIKAFAWAVGLGLGTWTAIWFFVNIYADAIAEAILMAL